MARARNIKPGFLKNEELCEVDPLGRLLFAGLWMLADRDGRLEDRPKRIKADCLPYDSCDIEELLWQLHERNFIVRYKIGEQRFIQIPKFSEHQHPHANETLSRIPELSDGCKLSRNGTKDSSKNTTDSGNAGTDSGLISDCLISDSLNPSTRTEHSESTLFEIGRSDKRTLTEKLADAYAPQIHHRHPIQRRDCGIGTVRARLITILKRYPAPERAARATQIDFNHESWCSSDDWQKDDGEFAKGLENWLSPTKTRYEVQAPPARASPITSKATRATQVLMKNLAIEGKL